MSEKTVAEEERVVEGVDTQGAPAETSLGLDANVASLLAYLFGPVSGLAVFLLEKQNRDVRFAGAQSLLLGVAVVAAAVSLTVLGIVVGLLFGNLLGFLVSVVTTLGSLGLGLVSLVLWVYLLVRAFQGSNPRLPVVADIADGLVD
jgi:uncharacterized membrane protein